MVVVTEGPIDHTDVYQRVGGPQAGSVVIHFGVVKPMVGERATRGIQFTRDGDLAAELREVESDLRQRFDVQDILLIRRLGELVVGDIIFAAAVSALGREDAFGACREAVERCKQLGCLHKEELYL